MSKIRKSTGFTMVELLVVVVVIGILAAIGAPNLTSAQGRAKLAAVKSNMHTCQVAAECYATDSGGIYGDTGADIAAYYPGGGLTIGGAPGPLPANPFTSVANDAIAPSGIGTEAAVAAQRMNPPGTLTPGVGKVGYNGIPDAVAGMGNTTYAIVGGDNNGSSVASGTNAQLVLSNH